MINYALTEASSSQTSAHFLQASAHSLQLVWGEACLTHSSEHALQISAHKVRSSCPYAEPLASNLAHNVQMSAQSRHNEIQS